MEIGISIGSNLGDRLANMRTALEMISDIKDTKIVDISPLYETEPVDVLPEYMDMPYLNGFIIIHSSMDLTELSRQLHHIEEILERTRTSDRNAPRPIDIDLIYADSIISGTDILQLPHPRWAERRFVVQPMAELRPDLVLPGTKATVAETLKSLPSSPEVTLYSREW